ncbi:MULTISPECIES: helix-turn-helix domain-containing protein [unclassified Leucobacter]
MLGIAAKGFGPLGAHDALRRISLLRDAPASEADRALAGLSGREREVAVLAGSGLTNSEIAERLYLSPATVAFHMRNVLAKLGLRSRRELRGLSR